jgi:hypothetical protein
MLYDKSVPYYSTFLLLFVIIIIITTCQCICYEEEHEKIINILKLLSIRNPVIVSGDKLEFKFKKQLSNGLMKKHNDMVIFESLKQLDWSKYDGYNLVTFINDNEDYIQLLNFDHPKKSINVVFLTNSTFFNADTATKNYPIEVNLEVYFVIMYPGTNKKWTWYEKYTINGHEIKRKLGSFIAESTRNDNYSLSLQFEIDYQPFLSRRSNFQGKYIGIILFYFKNLNLKI